MIRFLFFITLSVLAMPCAVAVANTDSEALEVDPWIAAYIDSQGGRARLESLKSIYAESTIKVEGLDFDIQVRQWIITPDRFLMIQEDRSGRRLRQLVTGGVGYVSDSEQGDRAMSESELQSILNNSDLQRDLKMRESYSRIKMGDSVSFDDATYNSLVFYKADGAEEHWFLSEDGTLRQKTLISSSSFERKTISTERYSKYIEVDGFRFPSVIHYMSETVAWVLEITECEVNPFIDPALFEK